MKSRTNSENHSRGTQLLCVCQHTPSTYDAQEDQILSHDRTIYQTNQSPVNVRSTNWSCCTQDTALLGSRRLGSPLTLAPAVLGTRCYHSNQKQYIRPSTVQANANTVVVVKCTQRTVGGVSGEAITILGSTRTTAGVVQYGDNSIPVSFAFKYSRMNDVCGSPIIPIGTSQSSSSSTMIAHGLSRTTSPVQQRGHETSHH